MTVTEQSELNAWIAEHVMGWREVDSFADLKEGHLWHRDDDTLWVVAIDPLKWGQEWRPTTDPAAAMAVLEKCVDRLKPKAFHAAKLKSRDGNVETFGFKCGDILVEAETLPLAICLFCKELFDKKP